MNRHTAPSRSEERRLQVLLDQASRRAEDGERWREILIGIARKLDVLGTPIANLPHEVAAELKRQEEVKETLRQAHMEMDADWRQKWEEAEVELERVRELARDAQAIAGRATNEASRWEEAAEAERLRREKTADEAHAVLYQRNELLERLEKAEKVQACGHHISLLTDDQCNRPEHRFCIFCSTLESLSEEEGADDVRYETAHALAETVCRTIKERDPKGVHSWEVHFADAAVKVIRERDLAEKRLTRLEAEVERVFVDGQERMRVRAFHAFQEAGCPGDVIDKAVLMLPVLTRDGQHSKKEPA